MTSQVVRTPTCATTNQWLGWGDVPSRFPSASFRVFAPGRVNLIGEHIDYSGLSVLPMAIPRGVELTVTVRDDDVISLRNDDERYSPSRFRAAADIEPAPAGGWSNYVRAPVQATVRDHPGRAGWRGFDATIRSDLPAAAGLSSSAAMVVGSGLAFATANELGLEPVAFAELMADAERYVGVRAGGMDQAICVGGTEHCASRVDFSPLRMTAIRVPSRWAFIVAHSLVTAEKAGAARAGYNQRTTECRRALEAIWARVAPPGTADAASYRELLALETDTDALCRLGERELDPVLASRFVHTISEAQRVRTAQIALEHDDLDSFASAMAASHASLRDRFGVSSPQLDRVVELALRSGARGARLTGAGFGGCAIVLCTRDTVSGVLDRMRADYAPRLPRGAQLDDVLFAVTPSQGARVIGPSPA
ncbi:MAG: galactokinase [Myxococcales bacterium FL481]|nr:MAG: galactokinase [Myxococcales bacterium FL481]